MIELFYSNEILVWWLLTISFFSLLGTLIVVPLILVRLPADYFLFPDRQSAPWISRNRYLRIPVFIAKNLLGAILVLAGILMLVLPGQGLLTIIIGLVLMEFPGKYHAERWVINRPAVLAAINWIRLKAGKPKLATQLDVESDHDV
ncbi:MAG: hypothetical protein ACI823_002485 [Chitinophagales bacterium]|jgi:hypothetical protein